MAILGDTWQYLVVLPGARRIAKLRRDGGIRLWLIRSPPHTIRRPLRFATCFCTKYIAIIEMIDVVTTT
jgi:hypothetical protein